LLIGFIGHFDTGRDYILKFAPPHTRTRAHTHTHTLVSSPLLLGRGFQPRAFPYFRVPELSPASATRF
jgi:hypothetical protein